MNDQISGRAAAARESARKRNGRFGEQAFTKASGIDLDGSSVAERAMLTERVHEIRASRLDPRTGALRADHEPLQWQDHLDGPSGDLMALPPQELSSDDLRTITDSIAEDDPIAPSSQQRAVYEQRTAHEAAGGTVRREDDGRVIWADADSGAPYRDTTDPAGMPAVFDAEGRPVRWYRGAVPTRRDNEGRRVEYAPAQFPEEAHPAVAQDVVTGAFTFYDTEPRHRDDAFVPHRLDGPAVADAEEISWRQHGRLERDPDDGPASIRYDGTLQFTAPLSAEQEARYGVTRRADGLYARPDAGPAEDYDDEPYDWAGSPVDPGFWVGTERTVPSVLGMDWSDVDGAEHRRPGDPNAF